MIRRITILAVVALSALALSACHGTEQNGSGEVDLTDFINPDGQALRGLTIESKAMMRTMKYRTPIRKSE